MNTSNDVKRGTCETEDRIVLMAFQNTQNGSFVFIVIKKRQNDYKWQGPELGIGDAQYRIVLDCIKPLIPKSL